MPPQIRVLMKMDCDDEAGVDVDGHETPSLGCTFAVNEENDDMALMRRSVSLPEEGLETEEMDILWEKCYDVSTQLRRSNSMGSGDVKNLHKSSWRFGHYKEIMTHNCWLRALRRARMRRSKSLTKIFHVLKGFRIIKHFTSRAKGPESQP